MDGSCHCGAVRWRFDGVPTSATSCNCSICRRHGALWAYGFEGEAFSVSGETGTYVWNNKALAFYFCARCACAVAWLATRRGEDGKLYGAVNLRVAVEPEAVAAVPIVHHDGETMSDLPATGDVLPTCGFKSSELLSDQLNSRWPAGLPELSRPGCPGPRTRCRRRFPRRGFRC